MGLSITHNCYRGSYGGFHHWRKELAKAADLPPLELMEGFFMNTDNILFNPFYDIKNQIGKDILNRLPIKWKSLKPDVLYKLLYHSDCEGSISAGVVTKLIPRLEKLLPYISEDWKEVTETFINGLKIASSKNEKIEFH